MTSDFLCRKWWFRRVCVSNSWTIMCRYITGITPTSYFPSQHKQRQDRIQRFWLYIPTADALAKFRSRPQVIESSDHLWCLHVSESARQRILSGSIKSWARCWIIDAIDDHLILDCFEGIPKDFAGESNHFSLDQVYNDLDRCLFVWWNLNLHFSGCCSEGTNLPKPDIVWYVCLRVWHIIMYKFVQKYIYIYIWHPPPKTNTFKQFTAICGILLFFFYV